MRGNNSEKKVQTIKLHIHASQILASNSLKHKVDGQNYLGSSLIFLQVNFQKSWTII